MKLIDILVEELPGRGGFPSGCCKIHQDHDGELWAWRNNNPRTMGRHFVIAENSRPFGCDAVESMFVTSTQYEAALAAKNDGWITWGGGKIPVEKGVLVDCRYRDGLEILGAIADEIGPTPRDASHAFWMHHGGRNDIIAYRLHKPAEVNPEWSGDGLPPVGCECEIHNRGEWIAVKIKFIGDKFVVAEPIEGRNEDLYENSMDGEGCYEIADEPERFRPLRTEADRKRYAVIAKLTNVICGEIPDTGTATAAKYAERVYSSIAAGKIPSVKLEG